jgi:hypothetical protein
MMPHATRSTRPTLLAILLATGALAGCDGDTESQAALRNTGHQFASAASGDPRAFGDTTTATYEDIVRTMTPLAGDENGYAEAAAVTVARAKLGLATQAAQESAAAETLALRKVRVIRGLLSEYLTLDAVARAAAAFDPRADLTELDSLIANRRSDAAVYQRQKSDIDAQIADLEAKIADLEAKAAAERSQAGTLGLEMAGVNAQRAAELAAEAREYTLRADQFELEAVRIQGRVGQLRPSAAEIGLNVQKAEAQIELLENSKRELEERARMAESDAAEARAAAAQARARLTETAAELVSFRESEVDRKAEAVLTLLGQVESALRDARTVLKDSAAIARASAEEVRGSVWARRAAGQNEAAAIYEALADASIPGPHAENARAAREAAGESADASAQAFQAAASALRSVRSRGDASDKLQAAAERIDRLGGIEPEPEPGDEAAPVTSMDDATLPESMEGMTFEEILASLPEESRAMLQAQFQSQIDMLNEIDDPDALRAALDAIDEQAAAMPAEYAPILDYVRGQIQSRIDALEAGGTTP